MEPQSQAQNDITQGAVPPGLIEAPETKSHIRNVENATAVRDHIQHTLMSVNSQKTADTAVQEATQAVQTGSLSKEQFGQMVDALPGQSIGYVYGSDKVGEILPPAESLNTSGMNEYEVDDLRYGDEHYTPGELNAMPKAPEQDKAA